jgi:transposase
MIVIGCDFHPSWQQICWVDTITGETEEKKLDHASGEAERFYRRLQGPVLIGMESTGNCQWFVELLTGLGHEVWTGNASRIRACDPRPQKHDRRDAALILKLLLEGRFPRIWTPSGAEKDLRQLLIHRYKLVRIRGQVKTEPQHLAMNRGVTKKRKLWSKGGEKVLRKLPLKPWASRRREDLFKVKEMLHGQIELLDQAVVEAAEKNERARLLMTQPGVGPIHVYGVCADHGRCFSLPAWEASGQLLGTDSAGVQFGWTSAIRIDQQAGEPVPENAAGRSSTERCGAIRDFGTSICIAATRKRKA